MNEQEATQTISDNLETAKRLIDEALTLGREFDVPVNLNKTGLGSSEMWYTDPRDYLDDVKNDYGEDSDEYRRAKELVDEGYAYDDNGYQVWGWMSSSTNC